MRLRADRFGGGKSLSVRENNPKARRDPGRGNRKHRHRRALDDSERGQKLRIGHGRGRPGRLRQRFGKHAREQWRDDAETARASRDQGFHQNFRLRPDDRQLSESRADYGSIILSFAAAGDEITLRRKSPSERSALRRFRSPFRKTPRQGAFL